MKKEKKDKHFIKKPVYEGGAAAMKTFVKENLRYPREALKGQIEGTVHVRYTINHKGKVVETKVIAGIGYGCDEEAERLVKLFEFSVPRNRKIRVQFHKTIHIHFRLPKKQPAEKVGSTSPTSYQYQYIPENRQEEKAEKKKSGGYSYQIKLG
jgi:TonB family protein